uniref:Vacuolar protein sorting-associated protein 11 homolog n=1 Tax=Onchocerca volvulus TaxID=6282 RepID=A0A8R1TWI0_ONCVO
MSLVETGWRQFTFFEKHNVYDPNNPECKFNGLKNLKAYRSVSGVGFTIFGEPCGAIFKLSRNLEEYCWIAHKRSLADIALAGLILATVGEDEEGINSLVKLWQLDRIEKDTPFCIRVIRVCPLLGIGRSTRACAVTLHSSLQHIAVGFVDSSVIYSASNVKEKSGKWLTVVNSSSSGPGDEITGVFLIWIANQDLCILYCLTSTSVLSFSITNKVVTNKVVHDAKGCLRDCWSFNETRNQLIVGSTEMVHFYEAERSLTADPDSGRGRCHALGRSNEKMQLIAFDYHVALLTRQPTAIPSSNEMWTYVVSIYDTEGQCVAFSCALPAVSRMFLLDNVLMVLSQDGTLSAVTEKSISSKLDILFKKNLYDLAVGVAKRSSVALEHLPGIYKKYGDYLYRSGDFENAVQQYMETVGYLEPSYVIKKFLDGSHIKELCLYLEALHSKGKANSHHATILLNCYTRLAAHDKIRDFIDHNFEFNIETAVQILRAANFTTEACHLCAKHKQHDALLSILIEDRVDYQSALKYISKLEIPQVEACLEKFGKCLLINNPEETMKLLSDRACFNQINALALMKVFIGLPSQCTRFIETALKDEKNNEKLRNLLLELRLRQWALHNEFFCLFTSFCTLRDQKILILMFHDAPSNDEDIMALIGEENLEGSLKLCQLFNYIPGIINIYKKMKRYDKLIEYYMRQNKLREIVELCEKENSRDLWIDVVVFASRGKDIDSDAIKFLLERIEATNSIHPLVVLEILSKSDKICVGDVRDYIVNWMERQNAEVEKDEETIAENEAKMAEIEEQIDSINYKVQIFQMNKCSACDTSLQLPAVHFLCKHSYHAHCLESYSEKADCCPACIRDGFNERIRSDNRQDFSTHSAYIQFQNEVNESVDCMSLISSYIGNGLFDSWSKEKESKNENELASLQSDTTLTNRLNLNQFENRSSAETSSMNTAARNPFFPPKTMNLHAAKPVRSTNPFDVDDDTKNPFEEDF